MILESQDFRYFNPTQEPFKGLIERPDTIPFKKAPLQRCRRFLETGQVPSRLKWDAWRKMDDKRKREIQRLKGSIETGQRKKKKVCLRMIIF